MNTITRCPSCATHYQVASQDLQAAKGWLRCGQCGQVFDSTGLVLRWTAPVLTVTEDPILGTLLTNHDDLVADPADRLVLDELLKKEDRASAEYPVSDLDSFEHALSSFKPSLPVTLQEPMKVAKFESGTTNWVMPYLVWVLVLALISQIAFVQRHAMASVWPDSEPLIRHVCQSFGCQVNPVRDVEGLVIDSSELIQKGDGHLLRWTVRNSTDRPLGVTALELTLLQGAGQIVLRRVLLPTQTGAPEVLGANRSWSAELALTVKTDENFSDYRLLSFYP